MNRTIQNVKDITSIEMQEVVFSSLIYYHNSLVDATRVGYSEHTMDLIAKDMQNICDFLTVQNFCECDSSRTYKVLEGKVKLCCDCCGSSLPPLPLE